MMFEFAECFLPATAIATTIAPPPVVFTSAVGIHAVAVITGMFICIVMNFQAQYFLLHHLKIL